MLDDKKYLAHVKKDENGKWEPQSWFEHSQCVAELAAEFASSFGNGDWAEYIGRLHDLGKLTEGWQNYIRRKTEYDADDFSSDEGRGNHSTLGAFVVSYNRKISNMIRDVIAYTVMGHHAGLPDYDYGKGACLKARFFENDDKSQLSSEETAKIEALLNKEKTNANGTLDWLLKMPPPESPPVFMSDGKKELKAMGLWIRMLFSCLVDADYLDTERFMNENKFLERGHFAPLSDLKNKFDIYMKKKSAGPSTKINILRNRILVSCREKAALKPGFFTLSVPTGAGKTLASMAFALEHSIFYDKERIIVAIPYTSIIEQTAGILKFGTDDPTLIEQGAELFGESNVIEHHCNTDPENDTLKNRLSCENWDAPIIVTTNVRLFESLAAAKPASCRKLHNIANSVIILDEVQLFPPEYLQSIVRTMEDLVEHFNVTILLCTATQPALEGPIGAGRAKFEGIKGSVELADVNREEMFSQFRRVRFHLPKKGQAYSSWEELGAELRGHENVLCVVNTRKSARDLHCAMPDDTAHLSGLMCAEDRSDVIADVKARLKNGEPVRLISTQLIEAGVDIDFPVVYRAYAGIDSLVQAAGRCNREGKSDTRGNVIVFNAPVNSPPGLLSKGEHAARLILDEYGDTFEPSDVLFKRYFESYYDVVNDFDKPRFNQHMLNQAMRGEFQFRTYAENYRMIDSDQKSILIAYHGMRQPNNIQELIDEFENTYKWNRSMFRKLQRFVVNVPRNVFCDMSGEGLIKIINESSFATLKEPSLYKPGKGLILENPAWEGVMTV